MSTASFARFSLAIHRLSVAPHAPIPREHLPAPTAALAGAPVREAHNEAKPHDSSTVRDRFETARRAARRREASESQPDREQLSCRLSELCSDRLQGSDGSIYTARTY